MCGAARWRKWRRHRPEARSHGPVPWSQTSRTTIRGLAAGPFFILIPLKSLIRSFKMYLHANSKNCSKAPIFKAVAQP
jgi:hypothetical protein